MLNKLKIPLIISSTILLLLVIVYLNIFTLKELRETLLLNTLIVLVLIFSYLVLYRNYKEIHAAKLTAKYWEEKARTGQQEGAEKQKKKDAADIPKGKETAPDAREAGTEAELMQGYEEMLAKKTPTKDLLAYMRKHGVPMGSDDLIT